jgi:serine/threonine protein kinase
VADLIGQSLGRYHILEQLGEGGMATVYKAYDMRLERDVAVKVIRREAFPPEQLDLMLKRFDREAKALARLTHPNIVPVIDYGDYEGAPYLVMPYLPGGTLKQKLGKPMPWQAAVYTILPVARALDFAHSQGIVHRDVKPSNILISLSGEPMLSDFGIAKILENEDAHTLTGTGISMGTPEYMAPEQWAGKVNSQTDIYALGVVFYEMVTGRRPYMADTPPAIMLMQATEPLPRPTRYVPSLPEPIERIIFKALENDPENRYRNMAALVDKLESLISRNNTVDYPGKNPSNATFSPGAAVITEANFLQEDAYATRSQQSTLEALPEKPIHLNKTANGSLPAGVYGQPKQGNHWKKWLIPIGIVAFTGCIFLAIVGGAFLAKKVGYGSTVSPNIQNSNPVVGENNTVVPTSYPSSTPLELTKPVPVGQSTNTFTPLPVLTNTFTPLPMVKIAGQWTITLFVSDVIHGAQPAGTCPTVSNVAYVFSFMQDNEGNLSGDYFLQNDPASGYGQAHYPFTGKLTGDQFSITSSMNTKTDQCYGNINSWQGTIMGGQLTGNKSLVQRGQGACCTYVGSFTGLLSQP